MKVTRTISIDEDLLKWLEEETKRHKVIANVSQYIEVALKDHRDEINSLDLKK